FSRATCDASTGGFRRRSRSRRNSRSALKRGATAGTTTTRCVIRQRGLGDANRSKIDRFLTTFVFAFLHSKTDYRDTDAIQPTRCFFITFIALWFYGSDEDARQAMDGMTALNLSPQHCDDPSCRYASIIDDICSMPWERLSSDEV